MKVPITIILAFCLAVLMTNELSGQKSILTDFKAPENSLLSKMDLMEFNMSRELPEITAAPIIYKPSELPIFCRIEHKLLKSANFNVKIRLGDVSYVDKLEGYK